jgi:anti-sigma regulatory factor (Ser/Thr protein kinase)
VPARRDSVGLVRHVLSGLVDDGRLTHAELRPVLLAVSEATTHAVLGGGEAIQVSAWLLPSGDLRIAVRDDASGGARMGVALDDDAPPAAGTLGLPTIAAVARGVELRRTAGGGAEVVMVFGPVGPAAGQSSRLL